MKVVGFLERKNVIRLFGLGLVFAPFINIALHLWVMKNQNHLTWQKVDAWAYLKNGNTISYLLALSSVVIGLKMLGGSTKAWRYVLFLIGSHLLIQVVNINSKAWQGPLAWPIFLLNVGLFFFIIDQLVWKIKANAPEPTASAATEKVTALTPRLQKQVVNLKSYRKILFSFGSDKPWGELKILSSEELAVKSFAQVPQNIENKIVQINFAKDVIVEIKFDHKENDYYYFKPMNMQKDDVVRLNNWLKKIAV